MNKIKKVIKKIKEGFVKEAFRQIIWIYALVNKHKKGLLAYSAISMVSMLITTFFSVQIKGVIDYLLAENWMKIMTLLLIYIIVGLVNVVLSVGGQRLSATINIKVRSDLCAKTYSKLVHAKWEQLAEFDSANHAPSGGKSAESNFAQHKCQNAQEITAEFDAEAEATQDSGGGKQEHVEQHLTPIDCSVFQRKALEDPVALALQGRSAAAGGHHSYKEIDKKRDSGQQELFGKRNSGKHGLNYLIDIHEQGSNG